MSADGCLTAEALEALAKGSDPDGGAQRHVDACAACRATLDEIREINRYLARFAPGGDPGAPPPDAPSEQALPPDLVPGYEILGEIHRGGQGVVYQALQRETRRTVAIKMLLAGSRASPRQRERFERELQLAAALRHPNIVTVYDGGYVAGGRYAFAMELIEGLRLDEWSRSLDQLPGRDARRRALRERLCLMMKVCDAVLCAHQHAVVHRDLKPANILVDAAGEPHILDFGIARSIAPADRTRLTLTGEFAGTLAYASPEQVSGDPDRVGTPTDIYSLGVLMYQVVSGRMPYSVDGPISQAVRNIESAEPAPLLGRTATADGPFVDGEVSTIILKAMAKDPARRYQTVAGLRNDIARYLGGEPIEARGDSTWYILRKSALRHRLALATLALVFLLVAGFGAAMAWQAHRIGVERDAAAAESDRARSVTDFVVSSLVSQDPHQGGTQDMSVAGAMMQTLEGLRSGDLDAQPETRALLLRTIALILDGNARSVDAEAPAREALEIEQGLHPSPHAHVAESLEALGAVLESLGRVQEAEPLYVKALDMRRRTLHESDPQIASSINSLAGALDALGDTDSAEALYVEALASVRRAFKGDHPFVANALNNLAYIRQARGSGEESRRLYQESLDMTRRLYPGNHPEVAVSLNNLAHTLQMLERFDEAESLFLESIEMTRALFAGDHPSTADSLNNLGHLRYETGRREEAEELIGQALEMNKRLFPGDHPAIATNLNNLAYVQAGLGRAPAAEPHYIEAIAMYNRLYGEEHPDTVSCRANYAICLHALGRKAEAITEATIALEVAQRTLEADHPIRLKCEEVVVELGGAGADGE